MSRAFGAALSVGAQRVFSAGLHVCAGLLVCAGWGCSLRSLDDLESGEASLRTTSCPEEMQLVEYVGGAFCIDRRETTRAEFDQLFVELEGQALPALSQPLCEDGQSFAPGDGPECAQPYQRGVDADLPVSCVNLCEATAYCESRGKRLCRARDGDDDGTQDRAMGNEWGAACRGQYDRLYPYGPNFVPGRCNVGSTALVPVGSTPGCETSNSIYDLSGNVSEWVDSCRGLASIGETVCPVKGGEYLTTERGLAACRPGGRMEPTDTLPPIRRSPLERSPGVGIRCCAD